MGGIIAANREVTAALAKAITETYQRWGKLRGAGGFLAHVIIAPSFEEEAVEIVKARKGWGPDVRMLAVGELTGKRNAETSVKHVVGGMLIQERDLLGAGESQWRTVTKRQCSRTEIDDLRFSWVVCKHVKSNAIVLAKDKALLGAGAGQMSRVTSSELAAKIAHNYGGGDEVDIAGCVLASDAFLPFPDSLEWAADVGATAVVQPGGAKKDKDVIERADALGLAMVFTGVRHFNH
jgi:phosphoribosylaminoimidazolecarboxamide formyltransferase/IMP cyclohydrolase